MVYLLFTCYLGLFCWLITRIKFLKEQGPGTRILIFLFLIRVCAAMVNGYINIYYYHEISDIYHFQVLGIEEFHLLFHHPAEYFTNIFQSDHSNRYGAFLESSNSYWNDTRSNLIVKMLSIFDIFSGTNFFINALFYNFLIFFGNVALYKVFIKLFPSSRIVLMICIFLLPSVIYFSSGIHRDGLIYLSLSMVIYHIYFMVKTRQYPLRRILITILFLAIILLLRNFVFIILVPALIAWVVAEQKPEYAFLIFSAIYFTIGVLFFCTGFLPPAYNLPAHVSNRQIDFIIIARKGASAININPLFPNFRSFLNNIPQALNHSFMRPYLTEHANFLYLFAGIEILLYEILFIIFIFFSKKNIRLQPLIYFSVFLTITMFLVIGYTIPIVGAIARYRSIYFPLILIPVICYTDWEKVKKIFI